MPKPKEPSEADIVFNRANLALAKHKRLVASWLPPLSNEEQANRKSADELEKDEEEMFAPVPELSVTNSLVFTRNPGLTLFQARTWREARTQRRPSEP